MASVAQPRYRGDNIVYRPFVGEPNNILKSRLLTPASKTYSVGLAARDDRLHRRLSAWRQSLNIGHSSLGQNAYWSSGTASVQRRKRRGRAADKNVGVAVSERKEWLHDHLGTTTPRTKA